jgi:hypothetical protein
MKVGENVITEVDGNDSGTDFPYGNAVKYPCDEHRRHYTRADANAVAEMVMASSWFTRSSR